MRRLGVVAVLAMLASLLPSAAGAGTGGITVTAATPTVFFRQAGAGLAQQANVTLSSAPGHPVTVAVTLNGVTLTTVLDGSASTGQVDVPDISRPGMATFTVDGGQPFAAAWKPERKWTLWLQPSSHVDQYSTSNATWTPEEHARVVEAALQLLSAHPEYRFQIEEGREIQDFWMLRPTERGLLAAAMRSGRMAVGAQYTGFHHDEASDESSVQGQLAYDGTEAIYRQLGIRPDAGITYDVPGNGLQMPQMLADSGIPYFLWAPNHSYALYERMHLPWLFRWVAPDGSSVLAWRAAWNYGYEKDQYYHLTSTQPDAESTVNRMLLDRQAGVYEDPYGRAFRNLVPAYPYSDLLIIWDYGDNTTPTAQPIDFVQNWNQRWAYPRFQFSTFGQFMDHMQTAYDPATVPVVTGHAMDAWTYVVGAQGLINQWTRRAERQLPAAEEWCSLAARLEGEGCDAATLQQAWQDVGMTEAHDWFYGTIAADIIAYQATGQKVPDTGLPLPFNMGQGRVPDFMVPDLDKANWARQAAADGQSLLASATGSIGKLVSSQGNELLVLNNATTTRSDLVAIPATDRHVIDEATGREVPAQRISAADWASGLGAKPVMALYAGTDAAAQPTGDMTVFVASDVPGLGYRRFRLSVTPGTPTPVAAPSRYQLAFDPITGGLSSIEAGGRELVDRSAPWHFGDVLLGEPAADAADIFDTPQPVKDNLQGAAAQSMKTVVGGFAGTALPEQCGPVLCTTRVVGTAADEHRVVTVYRYRGLDRVDLVFSLTLTKAKVARFYLAMPLAGSAHDITYSVPFGVHHVGRDEMPVEPDVHRMLTDWIEVGDGHGKATAVTSPDLGPFVLGRPDVNLMTGQFAQPAQPWYFPIAIDTDAGSAVDLGTYVARFSVASGSPGVGAALAESEREPLQAVALGAHPGLLTSPAASLLQVEGGRVTVVKSPRSGYGLLVRILASGGRLTVKPDPALHLGPPRLATLQERPFGRDLGTTVIARPEQIVTLLFGPAPAVTAGVRHSGITGGKPAPLAARRDPGRRAGAAASLTPEAITAAGTRSGWPLDTTAVVAGLALGADVALLCLRRRRKTRQLAPGTE